MADGLDGVLTADQIRTMIAIAEAGSFNRAAAALGVQQSAVNQQVGRIEERVGRRLFDRTPLGARLTLDGEAVLIYARAMAKLGRDLRSHLAASEPDAVLRIGFSEDFARTALPTVLGLFAREHPHLRFEALSAPAPGPLFAALDRRELDVVMTRRDTRITRGETLWTEPTTWIGRSDIALPVADPVPLVLGPPGGALRAAVLDALQGASRPWRVVFESSGLATLEAALRAGLGVAACPLRMDLLDLVHLDGAAGLPALAPSVFVYERAEPARSDSAEAFCEVLRTAARLSLPADAGAAPA
ncbi:LysR substrate-binding domain-containing protein [Lichenibacterium dinghuense]|uniref:LysR substrate-binding domain-containing protein n=1 Tax=Lichenibacterium dinghuense TaxID=2895977 RepID=UPI001F3A93CF|nr:LysR substrate-binding domain-containing protein [Lichenibacterium sp. 6Y81]